MRESRKTVVAEWIPVWRLAGAGHRIRKHRPDRRNGQISGGKCLLRIFDQDCAGCCGCIGYAEEAKAYGDLYEKIVEAIHVEYVTRSGRMVSETQTACVLMLYFDLIKPEFRNRILETLELNIGAHHNHLTTGLWVHRICVIVCQKTVFTGWRMKSL